MVLYKTDLKLIDVVKRQALEHNRKDVLDMCIQKGFDLDKHKKDLISWSINQGLYDSIELLDKNHHKELIEKIDKLFLAHRRLKTIRISTMVNVKFLYCQHNQLTELNGLEKLTKLEYFHCENNSLTILKGLENLKHLKEFHCENNSLTELNLENLTELEYFHCNDNNLTELKGLSGLTNLHWLDCRYNNLGNLKGVEKLIKLKEMHCGANNFPMRLESCCDNIELLRNYYNDK